MRILEDCQLGYRGNRMMSSRQALSDVETAWGLKEWTVKYVADKSSLKMWALETPLFYLAIPTNSPKVSPIARLSRTMILRSSEQL
jgi:hypothetical protein